MLTSRLSRSRLMAAAVVFTALTSSRPLVASPPAPAAPAGAHPALSSTDVDDIAHLLMLEDTRTFDADALTTLAHARHPEVRRRAILAIGHIVNPGSAALLVPLRAETDPVLLATVVFSTGQLKDESAVPWLADLLQSPPTPEAVAREAAIALGKVRTPASWAALAKYLSEAPTGAPADVVGDALLSIGRFTTLEDLAPVLRWTTSKNDEIRWRAAWALFRPRNPAATAPLLTLSADPSAEVRLWSVRGLGPLPAQGGGTPPARNVDGPRLAARLREATRDSDRRVRTEAVRALAGYDDDASFKTLVDALSSSDTWISVSAAEGLAHDTDRADEAVAALVKAAAPSRPTALRTTALLSVRQLGPAGQAALDGLADDPDMKAVLPPARRGGGGGARGGARGTGARGAGSGRGAGVSASIPAKTPAEYRAIVERWIVPDDNSAPRPHAIWDTPRGTIELELYPGDAPLATDAFVRLVDAGALVGTAFTRVVPNFVAQQQSIAGAPVLRDEVNQHGLTRGTLSWASSGLDTGRPGYTLGSTPQPHNEGDFTALGRVVRGMDIVDRLELGDTVTAARMVR